MTGQPANVPDLFTTNLTVSGTCSLPAACLGDTQFAGSGSTALTATKVQQQRTYLYAQDRNNYNAAYWAGLEICFGAVGTIDALWAKMPVHCTGGSTCTVTWYKNGASIGSVTFVDTDADNAMRTTTASSPALATTDDLTVKITVTGGTPGKGVMAFAKTSQYGS